MSKESRPTCVAVIGWFWIIVGGLMCFAAFMSLFVSVITGQVLRARPEASGVFRLVPLFIPVQLSIGIVGVISGANFLQLKRWSRSVLEVLSWLSLILIIAFGIFWLSTLVPWTSDAGHGHSEFIAFGIVIGLFNTAICGVPLGIVVKYLTQTDRFFA